jgi:dTDP-4-dehydrorhamnose reductase
MVQGARVSLPPHSLPKKALVLGGANGLLGRAVTAALKAAGVDAAPLSSADADLFDLEALHALVDSHDADGSLECLVNAVGYTQVDKAEDEPEAAYRLNASLPALLGVLAEERGLRLVHYSTDFVFDGVKLTPYLPADATNPLSVYGASKLAGEEALLDLAPEGLLILRTAWLFGPGKMNFVRRMLDLAAGRPELTVVDDQHGSPTYTPDLAAMTVDLLRAGASGLFHAVNSGEATWHRLASEALKLAGLACPVTPIATKDYPVKAVRPPYSVLDTSDLTRATGKKPRPWREALGEYVAQETAKT